MSDLNEFGPLGRKNSGVTLPSSFVRPVSLDRVRGMSASKNETTQQSSHQKQPSENNGCMSNRSHMPHETKESACQKLLNKKLFGISNKSLKSIVSTSRTDQLHREYEVREEKRAEKLREQKNEEMKGCSFKPKILVESTEKRPFQEFLDNQDNHCKKTAHKLEIIRDQLNKQKIKDATFRPRINKFSQRQVDNKENVHTRLYELSKSKEITKEQINQSGISSRQQSKKKFEKVTESPRGAQPKLITKNPSVSHIPPPSHRTVPTIPRNPSAKSIDRSKNNSLSTNPPPQTVSNNTEKQLIKKVIREMCSAAESLNIKSAMTYLELGNLMVAMRFINEENVERRSLYDLWVVLKGEQSKLISAYNLCRVLCAVMGLHNETMIQKEIELSQQPLLAKANQQQDEFDEGVSASLSYLQPIHLTEKESRELKKFLEPLSINRLNIDHSRQVSVEQHSFKPLISSTSKQLAERKRTKVLEQTMELLRNNQIEYQIEQSGEISHADYLILQKKAQEFKLNRRIEQKQAIQEYKMEELFRNQNNHLNSNPPSSTQRHLDLYALGAHPKQKRDRTSDQVQLERFRKQMTFKPDISKSITDNFQPVAKDIDKAIYRMYQGRKMRDNQPADLNKKKTPLLYLNINIDNKTTERLEIFEGDNPLELAGKFGQRFGLNVEARKRLSELIVSELKELI